MNTPTPSVPLFPRFTTRNEYAQYEAYLSALRKNGQTNLADAAPKLQKEFHLSQSKARNVVAFWAAQRAAEDRSAPVEELEPTQDATALVPVI